jgi:hypothetical protein
LLQSEISKLNTESWCLKTKGTKIYAKQNCPKIAKLYWFAWYLTFWSFQPIIASSYGKVDKLKKLWKSRQAKKIMVEHANTNVQMCCQHKCPNVLSNGSVNTNVQMCCQHKCPNVLSNGSVAGSSLRLKCWNSFHPPQNSRPEP